MPKAGAHSNISFVGRNGDCDLQFAGEWLMRVQERPLHNYKHDSCCDLLWRHLRRSRKNLGVHYHCFLLKITVIPAACARRSGVRGSRRSRRPSCRGRSRIHRSYLTPLTRLPFGLCPRINLLLGRCGSVVGNDSPHPHAQGVRLSGALASPVSTTPTGGQVVSVSISPHLPSRNLSTSVRICFLPTYRESGPSNLFTESKRTNGRSARAWTMNRSWWTRTSMTTAAGSPSQDLFVLMEPPCAASTNSTPRSATTHTPHANRSRECSHTYSAP